MLTFGVLVGCNVVCVSLFVFYGDCFASLAGLGWFLLVFSVWCGSWGLLIAAGSFGLCRYVWLV